MNDLLEINGLTCRYGGVVACRDITLSAKGGEITAVIGPNGAGKTSLLHAIMGFLALDRRSSIRFDGGEISGRRPHEVTALGIALVPEGRHVFPELTVDEHIRLGVRSRKPRAATLASTFDLVWTLFPNLQPFRYAAAGKLSGGQQQMVALARGIASSPRLLMIDELSLGLAPQLAAGLFRLLPDLLPTTSILLVDQVVENALEVSSNAYLLRRGEVVLQGTAAALQQQQELLEEYFG